MDAASAPQVTSVLERQKEPMDAESPESGAFAQGEHSMGLVCKSNVYVKDVQALLSSRD